MKNKKITILYIGDMQNGFMRENGNLYITGAQKILIPTNKFLHQINPDYFNYITIIQDTHFSEEYSMSNEGKQFPLHCEYGSYDWELAIDISNLKNPQYLMKNQFNIWGNKEVVNISFLDKKRFTAHENLFHFVDDPINPTKSINREEFIKTIQTDLSCPNIEVVIIGVASDYCNRYAMEGWLARGARVTIIRDLTKGLFIETEEIFRESQYRQYIDAQLRLMDSLTYLNEISAL